MKTLNKIFVMIIVIGLMGACSGAPVKSSPEWIGYKETGEASFYAMKFQGRKTASGERFNQSSKTAAHKRLPFGAKAKVKNIKNGKSVIVRINDRGPFIKGRIIDLSRSAYSCIADIDSGVIRVVIEVVK